MHDALFKICLFGDGGVGKTTLVNKYLTGVFKGNTKITVGMDFHIKKLNLDEKKIILQIWDFAGEDRFRFLLPGYMRGASGGIFMYDTTRFSSLKNINLWLDILNDDTSSNNLPIFLVGGKIDLEDNRVINQDDALEVAKSLKLQSHIECSAKTGKNVEFIFESMSKIMLKSAGLL